LRVFLLALLIILI